jgi:hypothetical protein
MARTNAFICDRCGKVTKNDKHCQIVVRRKSWLLGVDCRTQIDLCDSCYEEFCYFINPYDAPVPVTIWLKTPEDGGVLDG